MSARIYWEYVEPETKCEERRGRRGTVACEKPAGEHSDGLHAGRGRDGRWFFWAAAAASVARTEGE